MIHFIGVKQSWSNQRLIPTTICSVLTLIHFHSVLWVAPSTYPLLNYVSCIFDSVLLLVILVAFSLNILTQLLLEGSVTHPFVGHAASITHATEGHEGRHTRMEGFSNDIRHVRVGPSSQNDPMVDTTWFTECKRFGYAVVRFGLGCGQMMGRVLRGQPVLLRPPAAYSGQNQGFGDGPPNASQGNETDDTQQDVYERFLSGEVLSDDDEDFSPSRHLVSQQDDDNDGTGSDTPDEEVDTLALYNDLSAATP